MFSILNSFKKFFDFFGKKSLKETYILLVSHKCGTQNKPERASGKEPIFWIFFANLTLKDSLRYFFSLKNKL